MSNFIPPSLVPPGINDRRSRDFTAALGRVLGGFQTSALLIQDPMTVDAQLLPIMTIELGMSEFIVPNLAERHVRQLLARAPEIHAWTGTVYGTRRALGALGITVDWTQWWQATPKGDHDTHTVIAYVNEHLIDDETNLLSSSTQYAVKQVIAATQRWSQDIAFLLGMGFRSAAAPIAALQSAARLAPTLHAITPMPDAKIAPIAAISPLAAGRFTAEAVPQHPGASIAPIMVVSAAQLLYRTMEARL